MKTADVLKIQNRYIDLMPQIDTVKALKQFNNELIEQLEFEEEHPLVFGYETTKRLVNHGFEYMPPVTGMYYPCYQIFDKLGIHYCRIYLSDKKIIFLYQKTNVPHENREYIEIPSEDLLTDEYIESLLKLAHD